MVCNAWRKSEVINSQRSMSSITLHLKGTYKKCEESMNLKSNMSKERIKWKRKDPIVPKNPTY
jgi:hypothetical protein